MMYAEIFDALKKLRKFAEKKNDTDLLQKIAEADKTALNEIFADELLRNSDHYDEVVTFVFPAFKGAGSTVDLPANDVTLRV